MKGVIWINPQKTFIWHSFWKNAMTQLRGDIFNCYLHNMASWFTFGCFISCKPLPIWKIESELDQRHLTSFSLLWTFWLVRAEGEMTLLMFTCNPSNSIYSRASFSRSLSFLFICRPFSILSVYLWLLEKSILLVHHNFGHQIVRRSFLWYFRMYQ